MEIRWLPKKANQPLRVTSVNSVADRLAAVSRELDELPARFDGYLFPAAGGYNCRRIAGTGRISAHGYGIAVDIALRHALYWRWFTAAGERRLRSPERAAIRGRADL